MAKPEWGIKRLCQGCGAKFYDFRRSPIPCPKCGVEFELQAPAKPRRARPTAAPVKAKAAVVAAVVGTASGDDDGDDTIKDLTPVVDDDLPEDASELGEDQADMAEVVIGEDDEET